MCSVLSEKNKRSRYIFILFIKFYFHSPPLSTLQLPKNPGHSDLSFRISARNVFLLAKTAERSIYRKRVTPAETAAVAYSLFTQISGNKEVEFPQLSPDIKSRGCPYVVNWTQTSSVWQKSHSVSVAGHLLSYGWGVQFFTQWILVDRIVPEVPTSILHIQNQTELRMSLPIRVRLPFAFQRMMNLVRTDLPSISTITWVVRISLMVC
ncbi:hypothetical protein NPIL_112481 [Nephila pilipes]|uniref:Uncharacterized protein n=1 Tax=Nephila pilipes TaxID=299642 RepID=A0A8X6PDT9_NEPPI|nr:hypothetical protein NPIL_112481 [Nephila pilipes]